MKKYYSFSSEDMPMYAVPMEMAELFDMSEIFLTAKYMQIGYRKKDIKQVIRSLFLRWIQSPMECPTKERIIEMSNEDYYESLSMEMENEIKRLGIKK